MKPKNLLLLFLFALFLKGFAQETNITLFPNADINATLIITSKDGKPTGVTLPAVFNWDKNESVLQLEIKNIRYEKPIFLFSGSMPFKSVKKMNKQIIFSKEITKKATPKNIARSFSNDWLENLQMESVAAGKAKMYNLCEPPGAVFKFDIVNQERENCFIKMNLYMGKVVKKKSKSSIIIESLAMVNMRISLSNLCKNEELAKIIAMLEKKTSEIKEETALTTDEATDLPTIPEKTVKTFKPKTSAKDKKINNIADPQFAKYKDCENLMKVIENYNAALDAHEKAVSFYNNILDERKKVTPAPSGTSCQFLKTGNEKLMNLYYKIEQSNKSSYPALQAEYEKIKGQVEINEKCKEYAAYKEWCKGIEKLLKK